ncbi:LysR family transcriptional regulator [Pseudonocardiaceae bacterium YIM PH 21723]|nr:LysR family transcriptional regulator [Pseudonocardiaceae bacterium YIM PH 21723]
MDLRQLRYFVVVAEERSVTRAATRLHLTQPPLSAQLARLEAELGVPLLVRHRRGVDLTEAGTQLLSQARRLLADVDQAADAVRRVGEGRIGTLSVAFTPESMPGLLAPLLRDYHRDRPGVRIDYAECPADGVVERVRSGRVDLGLLHLPPGRPPWADLDVAVVHREPLLAAVPRSPAWADRVDLTGLGGSVFFCPSGPLGDHVRAAGGSPIVEVGQAQTAIDLVAAGLGVTLLPASACRPHPEVDLRPLRQHTPVVESAVLRTRSAPTPPAQQFLRLALATPEPDQLRS